MPVFRQGEAAEFDVVRARDAAYPWRIVADVHLRTAFDREAVLDRYRTHYAGEPLVRIADEAPWVSRIATRHHVELGGFTLSEDGHRLVVVAAEDNLLKGAATQALQNLNLAFGLDEFAGIPIDEHADAETRA